MDAFGDWVKEHSSTEAGKPQMVVQFIVFWLDNPGGAGGRCVAVEEAASVRCTYVDNSVCIIGLRQDKPHGIVQGISYNVLGVFLKFASPLLQTQYKANVKAHAERMRRGEISTKYIEPKLMNPAFQTAEHWYCAALAQGVHGQPMVFGNPAISPVKIPHPAAAKHYPGVCGQMRYPSNGKFGPKEKKEMENVLKGWGVWHLWRPAFECLEILVDVPKMYPLKYQTRNLGFVQAHNVPCSRDEDRVAPGQWRSLDDARKSPSFVNDDSDLGGSPAKRIKLDDDDDAAGGRDDGNVYVKVERHDGLMIGTVVQLVAAREDNQLGTEGPLVLGLSKGATFSVDVLENNGTNIYARFAASSVTPKEKTTCLNEVDAVPERLRVLVSGCPNTLHLHIEAKLVPLNANDAGSDDDSDLGGSPAKRIKLDDDDDDAASVDLATL